MFSLEVLTMNRCGSVEKMGLLAGELPSQLQVVSYVVTKHVPFG